MTDHLGEGQLKAGYWFVTHKIQLRHWLIALFFILNIVVYGYILFSLVMTLGVRYQQITSVPLDILTDRFTNTQTISEIIAPKPLKIVAVQSLSSFEGRLDIVADVLNPNQHWGATFDYNFTLASGATDVRTGFIMPGQEKYVYDLDITTTGVINIVIKNVRWKRENNFPELLRNREVFAFDNVLYQPASAGVKFNSANFTVTNKSNYNYYQPTFQVILLRAGQMVGFQDVTLNRLDSSQSQFVDVHWLENLPPVDEVQILPDINYLDEGVYLPIK